MRLHDKRGVVVVQIWIWIFLVQFQKTCCAMIGRGAQETTTRSALYFQVPVHNNSLGDALDQ